MAWPLLCVLAIAARAEPDGEELHEPDGAELHARVHFLALATAHVHACATHAHDSLGALHGVAREALAPQVAVSQRCAAAWGDGGAAADGAAACPPEQLAAVMVSVANLAVSVAPLAECCPAPPSELERLLPPLADGTCADGDSAGAAGDGDGVGEGIAWPDAAYDHTAAPRARELLAIADALAAHARSAGDALQGEFWAAHLLPALAWLERVRPRAAASTLKSRFDGRCGWRSELEATAAGLVHRRESEEALLVAMQLAEAGELRGAADVWFGLLLDGHVPVEVRATAQQASHAHFHRAGRQSLWLELLGTSELARGAHGRALSKLLEASDSAPAADEQRLHALVRIARRAFDGSADARAAEEAERARLAAAALRPELDLFAECARGLAAELGLRPSWRALIATDNTQVGLHLAALLGPHGAFNASVETRVDGFRERIGDTAQTSDAMLDLALLSRARLLVGTHLSTFSMLAAGMAHAPAHHVGFPTRHARCALVRSPLASLTPAALADQTEAEQIYSYGLRHMLDVPCAQGEQAPAVATALLALGGDSGLEPGALFQGTAQWAAALAELRDLVGGGDGALDADAPGASAAERAREVASVGALIAQHEARSAAALRAGGEQAAPRLLVASAFAFNVGNRALCVLAYALMAMATGRALVLDGSVLRGLALPVGVDVAELPTELGARVREAAGDGMRVSTFWLENSEALCQPLLPAECAADGAELCVAPRHGAPNPAFVAANGQFREWYRQHVGYTGAGLRVLMRWLMRPSAELERRAEAAEVALCGSARGCDIAIHVRRGSLARADYFFPEPQPPA